MAAPRPLPPPLPPESLVRGVLQSHLLLCSLANRFMVDPLPSTSPLAGRPSSSGVPISIFDAIYHTASDPRKDMSVLEECVSGAGTSMQHFVAASSCSPRLASGAGLSDDGGGLFVSDPFICDVCLPASALLGVESEAAACEAFPLPLHLVDPLCNSTVLRRDTPFFVPAAAAASNNLVASVDRLHNSSHNSSPSWPSDFSYDLPALGPIGAVLQNLYSSVCCIASGGQIVTKDDLALVERDLANMMALINDLAKLAALSVSGRAAAAVRPVPCVPFEPAAARSGLGDPAVHGCVQAAHFLVDDDDGGYSDFSDTAEIYETLIQSAHNLDGDVDVDNSNFEDPSDCYVPSVRVPSLDGFVHRSVHAFGSPAWVAARSHFLGSPPPAGHFKPTRAASTYPAPCPSAPTSHSRGEVLCPIVEDDLLWDNLEDDWGEAVLLPFPFL